MLSELVSTVYIYISLLAIGIQIINILNLYFCAACEECSLKIIELISCFEEAEVSIVWKN